METEMNELGSLIDIINNHKSDFIKLYQAEVNTVLELHIPECLLFNKNLPPQQTYDELCLHAYAHKVSEKPLARKIIELEYQYRGRPLPNPEIKKEVLKRTYIPFTQRVLKKSFLKLSRDSLKSEFYNLLPRIADYIGVYFLADYLPKDKLHKIRKPFIETKRRKIEFLFIQQASQFSRYEKGELIPPVRGYSQFCTWVGCKNKTELSPTFHYLAFDKREFNPKNGCGIYFSQNGKLKSIRLVKELYPVCSKRCYDAFNLHIKRHPIPD
jgi:hypothetical protein